MIFNDHPEIDLVIADINMPQINGRQLVEKLKRIRPYAPMMLLSDGSLTEEVHWADAMIARKTCSTQELLERIKVMSARKRGLRKGSESAMRCATNRHPSHRTLNRSQGGCMRVVQVWTLKRQSINPPEPLPEEESRRILQLWWEQDNPVQVKRMSFWAEAEKIKKTGRLLYPESFSQL